MILIFLKLEITNNFLGANHQIRNPGEIQRMLNLKLVLQNQEQTTLLPFINQRKADQEKSMFLVDTEVSTMKERLLMIFMSLTLKPLNGPNLNQVVTHLLCLTAEVAILQLLWRINHKY